MENRVEDFLKEINEILPPSQAQEECEWQECFDDSTGHSYYWNIKTDGVTWEMPEEYKNWIVGQSKDQSRHTKTKVQSTNSSVPPSSSLGQQRSSSSVASGSSFPSGSIQGGSNPSGSVPGGSIVSGSVLSGSLSGSDSPTSGSTHQHKDLESIHNDSNPSITSSSCNSSVKSKSDNKLKYAKKRSRKDSSDEEDERIVLISSYGGDTDSDEEESPEKKRQLIGVENGEKKVVKAIFSVDVDMGDVKTSKNEVNNIHNQDPSKHQSRLHIYKYDKDADSKDQKSQKETLSKTNKEKLSGMSLVAGYGNDSDNEPEDEEPETNNHPSLFPIPATAESSGKGHSTLFPIPTPIDIRQFDVPIPAPTNREFAQTNKESVPKPFQRKRKLDVNIVNALKMNRASKPEPVTTDETERLGLGFKSSNLAVGSGKSQSIMFVKSDTVNPSDLTDSKNVQVNGESGTMATSTGRTLIGGTSLGGTSQGGTFLGGNSLGGTLLASSAAGRTYEEPDENLLKEINLTQETLSQKLNFLSEGREPASPVQVMIIQLETLHAALNSGSLYPTYFHTWLKDTCAELIKLEKDATPTGWLLQWDRTNKRYYYYNKETGQSQWNYPCGEIVGTEDDAMDISTTPPPPDEIFMQSPIVVEPPPPPKITEELQPPPPPMISEHFEESKSPTVLPYPASFDVLPAADQPLPPGVDVPEVPSRNSGRGGKNLTGGTVRCKTARNTVSGIAGGKTGIIAGGITSGIDGGITSGIAGGLSDGIVGGTSDGTPGDSAGNSATKSKDNEKNSQGNDSLTSVLDSFYSDIAAIESQTDIPKMVQAKSDAEAVALSVLEPPVKKKKKVKLAQGLSMKKKGVSKLVEKWKSVQNSYD